MVRLLRFLSPVPLAFQLSLLLSAIAIYGAGTVARDSTLYFDAAEAYLAGGMGAALQVFDWPWFSVLLGVSHWLTGLPMEVCGYLWCALLMAGTCALLVDVCQRLMPGAGYLSCLVVLSVPGFNEFRSEILREFGFWFFCVLALWLVGRWCERGGWLRAVQIQLAIVMAAAFRLEAVFLMPTLAFWQGFSWRRAGWYSFLQLNVLPALAVLLTALFVFSSGEVPSRLSQYWGLIEPERLLASFDTLAGSLADSMLYKYSREDAGQILFLGMLGTLLLSSFVSLGPFVVPLLCLKWGVWRRLVSGAGQPFAWAWCGYFLVLLAFFLHNQFMISRYVSLLSVLAVPVAAVAFRDFWLRFPRAGRVLAVVLILVMLDNVISLGARKTHLVDAGHWMAAHVSASDSVYYEDVRISYYAGRGAKRQPFPRDVAMSEEHLYEFRYFFIEADADELWLTDWLRKHHRRVLAHFSNADGDGVLVLGE